MFEVIATICVGALCGAALLPGYETPDQETCESQLPTLTPGTVAGLEARDPVCQPVGEVLSVTEVAPGVHVHTGAVAEWSPGNRGDISNIVIVVGETSVAVVDTGSARWMGEALWRTVRSISDLPLSHVIVTHMHPDHALGAEVLSRGGATVVGHIGLDRALQDREANYLESLARLIGPDIALGTASAPVDVAVDDVVTLDLGDRTLMVRAWETAHTGTDLTVVDGGSGLLIAGDLVFDTHVPALDGSVVGWQEAMETLTNQTFTGVVPGHGAALLDWPDGAVPQTVYLDTLATETREAIAQGERLNESVDHVAQGQSDKWSLFDAFNPRNVTVAYTELEWE